MTITDLGKCNLFNKSSSRGGDVFHIQNSYGGIPQNLITNIIGLFFVLLLFIILRKAAWKVLNKIVNKNDVDRWTHLFFAFTINTFEAAETLVAPVVKRKKKDNVVEDQPSIEGGEDTEDPLEDGDDIRELPESEQGSESPIVENRQRVTSVISSRLTCWQWLRSIFTSPDSLIQEKCGDDALQYLRFQRHIIFYLMIIMVLSICVILPLNFQGILYGDVTSFEHTTLANLDPDSSYLWAHLCLSFLFFPMAILIMRRFSVDLRFTQVSLEISKTIMIEKIPKHLCKSKDDLLRYFREAFPLVQISDFRFAYDVSKLQKISESLKGARMSHNFCVKNQENQGQPVTLYPVRCSRYFYCCCCCCVAKRNGLEFYQEEEETMQKEFDEEKTLALKTPVGIAFVTFRTYSMSKDVFDAFQRSVFAMNYKPPKSTLNPILKPERWKVSFAPQPDDIYWENLNVTGSILTIKYVAVNILLFIFALFLTTPEVILTQFNSIGSKLGLANFALTLELPSYIVDFLPTLMLWGFTALLPLLVSWSDRFLGHWTRSMENHSIMKKTFWYLLFMVVFLPTFGFTSAQAGFEFLFAESSANETYRWECVFLPDSGAFFVNYCITAALVGAGLELIRFPDLLWYTLQLVWSRSRAETPYIRSSIKYEFRFGEQYARMVMIFCMTVMYCVSCPMITPFGTLYFLTKHYVDRHNLLFVYKPCKVNKKVHATAISFVILSTVILQFFMMIFSVLRNGNITDLSLRSKVSIGFFLLSVNIFSAQLWADTCRKFSPIDFIECTYIKDDSKIDNEAGQKVYLPETLMSEEELENLKKMRRAGEIAKRLRHASIGSSDIDYGTF